MKQTLLAVAIIAMTGCSQIDTGNVGISSVMGQVKPEVLGPGVYETIFKKVVEVTAKEVPIEVSNLTPKAKDNVTLTDVDLTVYYRIDPSKAAAIYTRYSGDLTPIANTGGDVALAVGLVGRMAREATYNAFAKHIASDAHNQRTSIAADIREMTQKEIDADAGKGWIQITNVIVRNIVTDPKLEDSIKASAAVEFQIRQKKQEITLAQSEAERQRVSAEGEARANEIISRSLSNQLIELRRIEAMARFAGTGTHTVLVPQGTTPLININK